MPLVQWTIYLPPLLSSSRLRNWLPPFLEAWGLGSKTKEKLASFKILSDMPGFTSVRAMVPLAGAGSSACGFEQATRLEATTRQASKRGRWLDILVLNIISPMLCFTVVSRAVLACQISREISHQISSTLQ